MQPIALASVFVHFTMDGLCLTLGFLLHVSPPDPQHLRNVLHSLTNELSREKC